MAESFERIKTWVKAHPWLAAAILLVVVVIGYIVYRRSRSVGQPSVAEPTATGAGGAGDGIIGQPSTGGDVTTPPQPVPLPLPTPTIGGDGGGGGFGGISGGGGGDIIPLPSPTPVPDFSGAYSGVGLAPPAAAAAQPPFADVSTVSAPTSRLAYSSGPGGKVTISKKTTATPTPIVSPAAAAYSSGPGGKSTKKTTPTPVVSPLAAGYSSGPGGKSTKKTTTTTPIVAAPTVAPAAAAYSSGPGGKKKKSTTTPSVFPPAYATASLTPAPPAAPKNKKGASVRGKANLKYSKVQPAPPVPVSPLTSLFTYYTPIPMQTSYPAVGPTVTTRGKR